MICRLNDPQKFHILQIYLFLCTGTTPWAATVNSACRASQGGGFFLQKEGDNHLFLVLRVSLKLGMGPCWLCFHWSICLNNSFCVWHWMFNVSSFLPDACKPKNESSFVDWPSWEKGGRGIRSLSSRCAGTRAGSTWTPMPRLVDVFPSTVTTIRIVLKDFC